MQEAWWIMFAEPEDRAARTELLEHLKTAQSEINHNLEQLRRDLSENNSDLIAECFSQLAGLSLLQVRLETASFSAFSLLKKEISNSITSAQGVIVQLRNTLGTNSRTDGIQNQSIYTATRQHVLTLQADVFERKIFDRYLDFRTPVEERAYRQREQETLRYIEQQLARKNPEGDLNAAGATMGQMLDAHAHGAGASPDFQQKWNGIVEATRRQHAAMRAAGQSTEEFDRNLETSVRRYLKDKGLSPTEIDSALARNADPLDAVAPFLKSEEEARSLGNSIKQAVHQSPDRVATSKTSITLDEQAAQAPSVDDVMARFKAAGVAQAAATAAPEHGVSLRSVTSEGTIVR